MGRRAHVRLDDPLAPPRARLRRAYRLFRSHDPRRSWKRPAQANSSRIGVFKRTLSGGDRSVRAKHFVAQQNLEFSAFDSAHSIDLIDRETDTVADALPDIGRSA